MYFFDIDPVACHHFFVTFALADGSHNTPTKFGVISIRATGFIPNEFCWL